VVSQTQSVRLERVLLILSLVLARLLAIPLGLLPRVLVILLRVSFVSLSFSCAVEENIVMDMC
jgi:hypothetical protein